MSLDISLYLDVDFGGESPTRHYCFEANYTHNCGKMAAEAGLYKYVWRPDECDDVKTASDLIEPLRKGILLMEDEPKRFISMNPSNGWGSYETFMPWMRNYLEACIEHPKALIYVSR